MVLIAVVVLLLHSAQCRKWPKDLGATDLSRHHLLFEYGKCRFGRCRMLIFGTIARPDHPAVAKRQSQASVGCGTHSCSRHSMAIP